MDQKGRNAYGRQPVKVIEEEIALEMTRSSGNVFADLGLPDAEEYMAKSRIAVRITRLIQEAGVSQTEAARLMGLTQPNMSDIVRGKLKGFSLDRLFQCLNALGQDVEITVRPKNEESERGRLIVASL